MGWLASMVMGAWLALTPAPAPPPTPTVTLTGEDIPLSAAEIPNPMRGQYEWLGIPSVPSGWPTMDVYYRDQFQWAKQGERQPGVYDFSAIEQGLAEAKKRGGRLGFRVMSYCPGAGDNLTPSWVPRLANGVPDWNSEGYLQAWEKLNAALGKRFNQDPRLGFVDIAGFGSCGEWYNPPENGPDITLPNAKRIIRAVVNAFPDTFTIMNVNNLEERVAYAYSLSRKVGSRHDCFGLPDDLFSATFAAPSSFDRWKVAPSIVEWCGRDGGGDQQANGLAQTRAHHVSMLSSGNFPTSWAQMTPAQRVAFTTANKLAGYRYSISALTLPQHLQPGQTITVSSRWTNTGVAPTYDTWQPQLLLLRPDHSVALRAVLGVDLRLLFTGSTTHSDRVSVPQLAAGQYQVALQVVDPQGYFAPLRLATQGRTPAGAYPLGMVTVVAGALPAAGGAASASPSTTSSGEVAPPAEHSDTAASVTAPSGQTRLPVVTMVGVAAGLATLAVTVIAVTRPRPGRRRHAR